MKKSTLTALLLLAVSAVPATAHRFWILSSQSVLSGDDQWVTFDAAISNNLFTPNHHAAPLDALSVTGPDGKPVELQNASQGRIRTTFDVKLTQPGTYKAATVRDLIIARWSENGETKGWRGESSKFNAADHKDKKDLKVTRSLSRVETLVTSGEPTDTVLKPTGNGLELVAGGTHPNDLLQNEKASFTLSFYGKPAAGAKITIVKGDDRYRNEAGEVTLTADAEGKFGHTFTEPGRYWINGLIEGEGAPIEGIPTESRSLYTTTVEVLPE